MAVLTPNKVRWGYVADDGVTYRVSAEKDIVDQGVSGGATVALSAPKKPKGLHPRRVYVTNGTVTRSIIIYDTTAAAWADHTGTVNLMLNSVSTAFTVTADRLPERLDRSPGAKQTT